MGQFRGKKGRNSKERSSQPIFVEILRKEKTGNEKRVDVCWDVSRKLLLRVLNASFSDLIYGFVLWKARTIIDLAYSEWKDLKLVLRALLIVEYLCSALPLRRDRRANKEIRSELQIWLQSITSY